jgi:hypothetical protein
MQPYQDGDTRVINGVPYVRQGGQWTAQTPSGTENLSRLPAAPKEPSPQTPAQAQQDVLSAQGKAYDVTAKPVYDRFGAIDKLRDDVRNDKRIQTYEQALPIWASALQSPPTPEGDAMLVNAYAKTLDPLTGVQQGETAAAQGQAPTFEQVRATLAKQFGVDGGGNFTPEGRQRIREATTVRMRQIADSYRAARSEYEKYISAAGIPNVDPETILGPNAGLTYQKVEEQYLGRQPTLAKDRTTAGDIGFNSPEKPVSPLTLEQQAAYDAFNKANPKATADQLRSFGQSIGVSIGNVDDIVAARDKGAGIRPGSDAEFVKPDISNVRGNGEVIDPLMRGVADTVTFGFGDELGAAVDTLADPNSTYRTNLARERAINAYDEQNNFGLRLTGQLAGGAVLPTFGASSVRGLATLGAGYGGAYGLGSSDGNVVDRLASGGMGLVSGGAVGGALGAATPVVARGALAAGRRFVGPSNPRQVALMNAATAENVPINISDLYPGALNTVATLETIPGASGPVREGISAGRDAIESRVQNLGRGGTSREDMGQVVQDAGRRFVRRANDQAGRLYDRAQQLAADTPIVPQAVMQTLAGLVRQESATPGGTRAGAIIQQYADAFSGGGPITIDGARRMRSELLARLRTDGGLSKGAATRITGQIMDGVNRDIERSLTNAGRAEAVQAYRTADQFYAQTRNEIEQVTERFIGTDDAPKSVEQTIAAMQNAAGPKGNAAGLARMLNRLSPDERRDYAATLVEPLGRASTEEPFSPATFIRNVRKISPAARRVIFGTDGERSIQNLVSLSNAKKETVGRLNNSRSGQVSNYRAVLSSLVFGIPGGGAVLGAATGLNAGTGAVGGAAIAGTGIAASRLMARALMNEEFTRLLAQTPTTANPRVINNHIGRLRALGAKDPNVRAVVESLEQRLLQAVNDNSVTRAAASPDEGQRNNQ